MIYPLRPFTYKQELGQEKKTGRKITDKSKCCGCEACSQICPFTYKQELGQEKKTDSPYNVYQI